MRRYLILLIMVLSSKTVIADSIMIVGDSLSAAYGFELEKGWASLLQQKLDTSSEYTSWDVINASVAGETTAGGLARLPELLSRYNPEIIVLALGANDGLRGQPIEQLRQNLRAMIRLSRESGYVLLLGMKLPPNYGKAYTNAFEQSFASLATEFEIEYLPFFIRGVTEYLHYMQADNFHPNAAAQQRILDNIWPVMKTVIDSSDSH